MNVDERDHDVAAREDRDREAFERSEEFVERERIEEQFRQISYGEMGPSREAERSTSRPRINDPAPLQVEPRDLSEAREIALMHEKSRVFWPALDNRFDWFERLVDLRAAETILSTSQGREKLRIVAFRGPPSVVSFYDYLNPMIGMNLHLLKSDRTRDILWAFFHETRHAYQFDVIRRPHLHPEVHPSHAALWAAAVKTYRPPPKNGTEADFAAYFEHPFEVDARWCADRKTARYFDLCRRTDDLGRTA